ERGQEQTGEPLAELVAPPPEGERGPNQEQDGQNADADVEVLAQTEGQPADDEGEPAAALPAVPQPQDRHRAEQAIPDVVEGDAAHVDVVVGRGQIGGGQDGCG